MESSQSAAKVRAQPEYDRGALPVAESGLSRSERLRLSLWALAIAALALGVCAVLGLVIRAAVYGG